MCYVTREEIECKGCGRTIRRNELQYDSPEGRICLDCYKLKQPQQATPLKERREPQILEILKTVGLVILFALLILGVVILGALFFFLIVFLFFMSMGTILTAVELLGVIWCLVNPFFVFEHFGWIGIGGWLVLWFLIVVFTFSLFEKS